MISKLILYKSFNWFLNLLKVYSKYVKRIISFVLNDYNFQTHARFLNKNFIAF